MNLKRGEARKVRGKEREGRESRSDEKGRGRRVGMLKYVRISVEERIGKEDGTEGRQS